MGSDEEGPVAWLRAQVEARKAAACSAASDTPSLTWTPRMHPSESVMIRDGNGDPVVYDEGVPSDEEAALMAWNDPLDTIARCEAELAILDEHRPSEVAPDACRCCKGGMAYPCRTVRLLASGYRHRYGFPKELCA